MLLQGITLEDAVDRQTKQMEEGKLSKMIGWAETADISGLLNNSSTCTFQLFTFFSCHVINPDLSPTKHCKHITRGTHKVRYLSLKPCNITVLVCEGVDEAKRPCTLKVSGHPVAVAAS